MHCIRAETHNGKISGLGDNVAIDQLRLQSWI